MKKYRYILYILLFMICPNLVAAQTCSNADKVRYQEMAKKITFSYDYIEEDEVYFKLTILNNIDDLYIRDLRYEENYFPTSNEFVLANKYYPGFTYKFVVYTKDPNCSDEKLYIHYVNLPHYNQYHEHFLCKGIEEFKYCKKWINNPMSFDNFIDEVLKYRESLEISEEVVEEEKDFSDYINSVLDFYLDYYYFILPAIIIVCLIIVIRHNKKNALF